MTEPTPPFRRARRPAQRDERRRAILAAARALWAEGGPYDDFTMAALAARAGLGKGTLYGYYTTKEGLFLALLEDLLVGWLGEAARALKPKAGAADAGAIAAALSRTLVRDEALLRLLQLGGTVLERGADPAAVAGFKLRLLTRLNETGAALEGALPALPAGAGFRFLVHALALVTGLQQALDAGPVARSALDLSPDLAPLRLRFDQELPAGLAALLHGFSAPT